MALYNQFVSGYPQKFGDKIKLLVDHIGPAVYVVYNASTGAGDVINASDLGVGGFEEAGGAISGFTMSGTYFVQLLLTKANDWVNPSQFAAGSAGKRVTAKWFTTSAAFVATTTEVTVATDLSAEIVRLRFLAI